MWVISAPILYRNIVEICAIAASSKHNGHRTRRRLQPGWGTFGGLSLLPRQRHWGLAYGAAKKGPPLRAYVVKLSFRFDNATLPRVRPG